MNILVIYLSCTTTHKVSKSLWSFRGEHGRKKMQCEIEPWPLISSIQARRAGLNYLQFSPSHHFPCWSLSLSSACVYTSVLLCKCRLRKERKMKKEKCMFSRPKCLWWMGWLCKPWATSFVIWFQWHSHLEVESIWFSALTEWLAGCVRKYVCPSCKKLNTSKEPLRGPGPFPSEASMERLTG